jgi:hypothetical protein
MTETVTQSPSLLWRPGSSFFLDAVHRFYCPRKEVGARSYYDLGTNAPIQRYVCVHDVQRCDATTCSPAPGLVVEVLLLV